MRNQRLGVTRSKRINKIMFQKDVGPYRERTKGKENEGKEIIISTFHTHYQKLNKDNSNSNEMSGWVREDFKEAECLGLDKGLDVGMEGRGLKQE
jgi:hypothetical protein